MKNVHLTRKLAKRDPEPRALSAVEEAEIAARVDQSFDAIMRFENRDRYVQQSANTKDGKRAEPPARAVAGRGLGR